MQRAGSHSETQHQISPKKQKWPLVRSALLLLPSVTKFAVQFSGVPCAFASSPLASPPSFCAACAAVGVLGRRGFSLESAAARVCREAGGRVSVNVLSGTLTLPFWCLGQHTSGSGGRRVATVPRSPIRRGHHHGESTEKGRFSMPLCHCGRHCLGESEAEEGDVSRIGRTIWSLPLGCLGL